MIAEITNCVHFVKFCETKSEKMFMILNGADDQSKACRSRTSTWNDPGFSLTPGGTKTADLLHANVFCNDDEIFGYRYKCLECSNYDMCMLCELKMIHKEHKMMRFADPNVFVSRFDYFYIS